MTKKCGKCGEEKMLVEFRKRSGRQGLSSYCNECARKASLAHYYQNNETCLANNKLWRIKNPDKLKKNRSQQARRHYEKYKEQMKQKNCKYHSTDREKLADRYIKKLLIEQFKISNLSNNIIQAKREQLQALRLHKKIKEVLNENRQSKNGQGI